MNHRMRPRPASLDDRLHSGPGNAVAAQIHSSPMLSVVRSMSGRGWAALGLIAAAGAMIGGALGSGWTAGAGFRAGVMVAAVVITGRAMWRWVRTPGRRARAGDSLRSRVASFGGGAYGVVGLGFWCLLEAQSLGETVQRATGVQDLVRTGFLSWFWGFSVDSIMNAVWASIWPVYLLSHYGLVAAGVAYGMVVMADRMRERYWSSAPDQVTAGS